MNPKTYFVNAIAENQITVQRLTGFALLFSLLRLFIFGLVVLMIYVFWGNTTVISIAVVSGLTGFIFLISKYTDVRLKRDYHQNLKELNAMELQALSGDLSNFDGGKEFLNDGHYYNQDIDLFGEGSLFQLINRTGTEDGKHHLASLLNSNNITQVQEKQAAISELSNLTDWRQHYQVTASLIRNEVEASRIIQWMKNHKTAIPQIFNLTPLIFSLISLGIFVGYGLGFIPGQFLLYFYLIGLTISALFLKRVNVLYQDASNMKETFAQYAKLIACTEKKEFKAEHLLEIKALLVTNGIDASKVLSQLSKEISNLDQRNNILFGLLANGFLLWDIRYAYRVEKWIEENKTSLEKWLKAVAAFDAMNCLGNFAFTRSKYIYPELISGDVLIANSLGHPLLDEKKRVDNDITISESKFLIITGANMAGKSTFLRTVAINIVMSNCGLPVCASSFKYQPIKLISSMRTSDSLQNDESYFFSELKRLKFIVEEIEKDAYFVILDEILKGTNSRDKAEGSQKFVERLVASKSTGLVATHDLSLCTIADNLLQVENYYFDAQIANDELFFDYKFKEGICQNMNASFLLKKMEIV